MDILDNQKDEKPNDLVWNEITFQKVNYPRRREEGNRLIGKTLALNASTQ